MTLAFILYKYFPFGGLQRDFLRIALECQRRGHSIRVYALKWEGGVPEGFDVRLFPAKSFSNHRRHEKFVAQMNADINASPVDKIIGFNKMPGLDIYYAADTCYLEKAHTLRHPLYRLSGRYRHFSAYERAVFEAPAKTVLLMIAAAQKAAFIKHYGTPPQRFFLLPPGIAKDRCRPENASEIRAGLRHELGLSAHHLLLLQIGSGFKTKGLDRSLKALSALPPDLRGRTRFIVIGQDNPRPFERLAKTLGIDSQTRIFSGRDDIPRFLLGADLLIHPAYNEAAGIVLLEAMVSGLPVLTTDVCGYAPYIADAHAGQVLSSPFLQKNLDEALNHALSDVRLLKSWSGNGLEYAQKHDLYAMPKRAADIILEGLPHG